MISQGFPCYEVPTEELEKIDLRSDTVTQPSEAMREAIRTAEVGDDVYGEDGSINRLESQVASLVGKEAALFVPSGTMANQIAINLQTKPGDSVLTEEDAHCFRFEAGAASAFSGVQFDFLQRDRLEDLAYLESKCRLQNDIHEATTSLLVVENTHNFAGGDAHDKNLLIGLTSRAKELGLKTHCDGARLWNAALATGTSESSLAEGFDSVAVCFSKGLGAPVGSAVCGTREFTQRARKLRKRFGGAMRQAGVLAAAASYALDQHRERLSDDHRRAQALREGLETKISGIEFKQLNNPTNMVYFRIRGKDGNKIAKLAEQNGVLMHHLGDGWLRAVLHLHIDDSAVEQAIETISSSC